MYKLEGPASSADLLDGDQLVDINVRLLVRVNRGAWERAYDNGDTIKTIRKDIEDRVFNLVLGDIDPGGEGLVTDVILR